MAGVLAVLTDKKKRAINMARFRAWWEGDEFDEAATLAALEAAGLGAEAKDESASETKPETSGPHAVDGDAADALFDDPPAPSSPRFAALQKFWGEGRIMPSDDASDAARLARLELPEQATLAIFGPGLAAPLAAMAHNGETVVFEWRADAQPPLEAALKRGTRPAALRMIDLDAFSGEDFPTESFDGAVSLDEFTYADPARFIPALAAALKPGARVLMEFYAGHANPALAPAFATAFAEPRLHSVGDLIDGLKHAGFAIDADEDVTAEHIAAGKAGFKHLERALAEVTAADMNRAILQEIVWEATAWRARLKVLNQSRLERRRIVARKQD